MSGVLSAGTPGAASHTEMHVTGVEVEQQRTARCSVVGTQPAGPVPSPLIDHANSGAGAYGGIGGDGGRGGDGGGGDGGGAGGGLRGFGVSGGGRGTAGGGGKVGGREGGGGKEGDGNGTSEARLGSKKQLSSAAPARMTTASGEKAEERRRDPSNVCRKPGAFEWRAFLERVY